MIRPLLLGLFLWLSPHIGSAQEPPEHAELRTFREQLVTAVERGDLNAMLAKLHPEVVITWQNGEVCHGRDQVREFYERMANQSKKPFQGYKIPPAPDTLTRLYAGGSVGVVSGHHVGRFYLAGREVEMPNRWSATLVKENGEWLLAGYHVSMNVLDNPLLNGVKKAAVGGGVIAMLVGGSLGWVIARKKYRSL